MNPNGPAAGAPPPARAVELCRYLTLSEEAQAMLSPEIMPDAFAELLVREQKYPDAVQIIAHHLPKRQAVFWAMTCVRQAGDPLTPEMDAALRSAEKWIAEPTEENRKSALKAAEAADTGTAAGCTALAACYSDGLPRTDDPRANARAWFMTAKLVASAVLLAAAKIPDQMQTRFANFAAKGLDIVKKTRR